MELKEGMVLNYNTCDAFDPIYGTEYNKHVEKMVIVKSGKFIELYNLTKGYKHKVEKEMMLKYIKAGIYTITNEKA